MSAEPGSRSSTTDSLKAADTEFSPAEPTKTDHPATNQAVHGYSSDKAACLRRLKRIEGQVRGIARMIDEDQYCINILTQVAAANSAMHAVSLGLLENHLQHCVVEAAQEARTTGSAEAIDAKVKEATQAISRLLR
ncbi:metal-sensitive transcriptional regulator [Arthrobacter sp. TMN-50]